MKKNDTHNILLHKLINLTNVSILGGHIRFGFTYLSNSLSSDQLYDLFEVSLGIFSFGVHANKNKIGNLVVKLNGTTLKLNVDFRAKSTTASYSFLQRENFKLGRYNNEFRSVQLFHKTK